MLRPTEGLTLDQCCIPCLNQRYVLATTVPWVSTFVFYTRAYADKGTYNKFINQLLSERAVVTNILFAVRQSFTDIGEHDLERP
jgi:hypothetical protein